MQDPIYVHRGRLHCRDCGHSLRYAPGSFADILRQANDFGLFHRHPKNEKAPQRLDPAGEQIKNPRSCTHEHDHITPPQAERQAAS